MEPRTRPRPKGPQFSTTDLAPLLAAFGDASPSLASTIAVLDGLITDYIIEVCHEAAGHSARSGRQKVKQEDFQWALRRDGGKLWRANWLVAEEKRLKRQRAVFEVDNREALASKEEIEGWEKQRRAMGRGGKRRKGRSGSAVGEGSASVEVEDVMGDDDGGDAMEE